MQNNALRHSSCFFASPYPSLRWEELHALASEPVESHVFFAEHVQDAVNGLYTTLTTSSVCTAVPPGSYRTLALNHR